MVEVMGLLAAAGAHEAAEWRRIAEAALEMLRRIDAGLRPEDNA